MLMYTTAMVTNRIISLFQVIVGVEGVDATLQIDIFLLLIADI